MHHAAGENGRGKPIRRCAEGFRLLFDALDQFAASGEILGNHGRESAAE
jgi:hypothetical protein